MYKLLPILLFAFGLAVTSDELYDNSYALIIGISEYDALNPYNSYLNLNYGASDAEAIQTLLISQYDFPVKNTTLLKNEEATKHNILKSLSDIIKKAKSNDRVLIYFAMQGMTEDLPDGGELGYLIPVDGELDDLFLTSISMDDLKKIALMSKAKHILYLVDACYGGIASFSTRGFELNSTAGYIRKIAQDKSRQIITAGGRSEQVIEKAEWGHSAFSLNLLRGLGGGRADLDEDGAITASELGIYLKEKVTIDSENQQSPQIRRLTSNVGEFIFIKNEEDFIKSEEEDIYIQTLEQVMNQEKQKSYDFLIDNLDSVMQSSNYESMLSELSKEQLITLFSLSNKQKDILSVNSKEKELFSEKGSFYDNSFAVIIGINEYTKSQPLQYAVNDAIAIKELLIEKFGFKDENVRLLIDAEATYSSIRNELYSVAKLAKTNDRILIYFSGHGQTIPAVESGMQIGYLIPVNGDIKEPTLTGIPMDEIFRICQSKSKHMLFLMDACYSGLMAASKGVKILEEKGVNYIYSVANKSARQIITAGTAEQEVWEGAEWEEHGIFTLNILKALDNWEADNNYEDGYITATELGQYLKINVSTATSDNQTPQVKRIKYSKGGEFIFTRNP